jgi:carbon starvation protein CstA
LLPIDKIIGRFYPIFSLALLVMVSGLGVSLLTGQIELPAFTLRNLHPEHLPAWPLIFITVSCGAVSGFHATQSPLMARCLKNEKHMRFVFYGAMISEGLIALIWASAAQGFYHGSDSLKAALETGGPGAIVHDTCIASMGFWGGVLAVLGVVVLPITSGDTAFRVSRLILADYFRVSQKRVFNRYLLALPLFAISLSLNFVDFSLIWRYFGWANQTLAAVALWTATVFLARRHTRWWMAFLPALFMTVVTSTYILVEEVGFGLDSTLGTILGLLIGLAAAGWFLVMLPKMPPEEDEPSVSARPSEAERRGDSLAC